MILGACGTIYYTIEHEYCHRRQQNYPPPTITYVLASAVNDSIQVSHELHDCICFLDLAQKLQDLIHCHSQERQQNANFKVPVIDGCLQAMSCCQPYNHI